MTYNPYVNKITSQLSAAGIFPPVPRSLWNPMTPSSQTKICPTADSPVVNIYFETSSYSFKFPRSLYRSIFMRSRIFSI